MNSQKTQGARSADFDFLFGRWSVENRRLKERFAGCTEWETFPATAEFWPLLGGLGNVDTFKSDWPQQPGFEGATVRIFDPARGVWSIYWMDNVRCRLDFQVEGRFENGLGTFLAEEEAGGRTRQLRFLWRQTGSDTARWEQAYYLEELGDWETNWIMEFRRVPG
jgi:hypothetical protein